MVSGCFDAATRRRLLENGARACIDKPPNFEQLVALLRSLLP
jgi:DNA-binding response OmpR family regulator